MIKVWEENDSVIYKIVWSGILAEDLLMKIFSMFLCLLLSSYSISPFDILGDAFAVIVLVEFAPFTSNLFYAQLEAAQNEIVWRDDYL